MSEKSIYPSYIIFRLKGELNNANLVLILQTFGKVDEKLLKDFANIEKEATLLYGAISGDFSEKIRNEKAGESLQYHKNLAENKVYNLLIDTNIDKIEEFKIKIAGLLGCKNINCLPPYVKLAITQAEFNREFEISLQTYNPQDVTKPYRGSK